MAKILEMPKLSPTMEEGVLSIWHKRAGDTIAVDDLLAEVETDKATMEFRAFDQGTLLVLLVAPGAQVKLGQPVAILGAPGEDVSELVGSLGAPVVAAPTATPAAQPPAAQPSAAQPPAPQPSPRASASPQGDVVSAKGGAGIRRGSALDRTAQEPEHEPEATDGRVLASPYVRKIARDRGIDLEHAVASGKRGRVLPEDLESARPVGTTALVPAAAVTGPTLAAPEARPLSPMRKTIARRLVESKSTVPHFYLTVDVDAAALVALREDLNRRLAEATPAKDAPNATNATKLSVNDLLVKAVALALVRVPECNAQFTEEALLIHRRVDISVAVAVPDGLVTPVVRDADKKSVASIAAEVRELARRARAKKLRPEEMSQGTFSISNLGMFGIDSFAAVINPPEGAILAVGRVRDEAVVVNGGLAPGKRLGMTLSCDHRVIDGAVGAAFLAELRALIERPLLILAG